MSKGCAICAQEAHELNKLYSAEHKSIFSLGFSASVCAAIIDRGKKKDCFEISFTLTHMKYKNLR